MAVQKNKKSPSRRGMRRAHHKLSATALSEDKTTGVTHQRHHVALAADGDGAFYRGREIIAPTASAETEEEET